MLKKLLYLYNDGHNPFPSMGQGGLGYHIPQYRLRGKGKSHRPFTESDSDEEEVLESKEQDIEDSESDDSQEQREEDERLLQVLDDFNNPDTGLITEIEGENYERMTPEHKLSLLYSLVNHTDNDDFKTVGAYSFFTNKLKELLDEQNMTLQQLEDLNIDEDEEVVKEDITDIKKNNLKLRDPNISQSDVNEIIKTNTELILKYKDKLIDDGTEAVRQKMIQKGNLNPSKQDLSGKGFEEFLCTSGESLIYKSVGQIGQINNFDDHRSIPVDKQKYGVVDLFVDNGIIECKDYKNENMNEKGTFNIQESKLIGNYSFNIFFEKIAPNKYVVSNILFEDRPLLNSNQELNKYVLLVNASDGIYKYDFLKDRDFVNDENMTNVGSNIYKFNRKTIPMTMDYVSGGKTPVKSLRIDKSKFKKLK